MQEKTKSFSPEHITITTKCLELMLKKPERLFRISNEVVNGIKLNGINDTNIKKLFWIIQILISSNTLSDRQNSVL